MMSGWMDDSAVRGITQISCGHAQRPVGSEDIDGLGQMVAARLLAAGLGVHSAGVLAGQGPVGDRCTRALDELDDAMRQLGRLMDAVGEYGGRSSAAGAAPRLRREDGVTWGMLLGSPRG